MRKLIFFLFVFLSFSQLSFSAQGRSGTDDLILMGHLNEGEGLSTKVEPNPIGITSGTLTNGATWTKGKFGRGVDLDGVNDDVRYEHSAEWNLSTNTTVSIWAKPKASAACGELVATYNNGWAWGFYGANLEDMRLYTGSAFKNYSGRTGSTETWHFYAFTKDSSNNLKFYTDGILVNEQTGAISAYNGGVLVVGARNPSAGCPFFGVVDEPRIWNKVLSESEIRNLYREGFSVNQDD